MSEANAAVMTKLLGGVIQRGTASSVSLGKICECAGKSGTSQDDRDRWFIGYTPEILCGVWCGFEYPEPVRGSSPCTAIWDTVMHRAIELRGGETAFAVPGNVIQCAYCKDSGKLPAAACALDPRGERSEVGWFVKGTEPSASCDCHIPVKVDTEGGVCHGNCPDDRQKTVALIRVTRRFPMQVTVTDAQYVMRGDPNGMKPNPNSGEAYFEQGLQDACGRSATAKPFNRSCTDRHDEPDAPTRVPTPWDAERDYGTLTENPPAAISPPKREKWFEE